MRYGKLRYGKLRYGQLRYGSCAMGKGYVPLSLEERCLIQAGLSLRQSPAAIRRTLALMESPVRISCEAIYTALYAMPRGVLREKVLAQLRRGHKGPRLRACSQPRRNKAIPDMVLIDQRPAEVDARLVPGHWEGDLLIGKGNRSQVGTLVERKTLFVALIKLDSARAPAVADGFATILNRVDSQLRCSLTYDQGTEMAHRKTLTAKTGIEVYFAHPHSPWQRGISENTNGLLRLPKSTDLSLFSQSQLDNIAWRLNTRPRKTLAWKTPEELFLPQGAFDFVKHWHSEDDVALRS